MSYVGILGNRAEEKERIRHFSFERQIGIGFLFQLGWMLIKLLYVAIIYKAGINIGILTPNHILLFVGTYILMTGFYMLYIGNFFALPNMIREGELDLYLTGFCDYKLSRLIFDGRIIFFCQCLGSSSTNYIFYIYKSFMENCPSKL